MGLYKYLRKAWRNPSKEATKERLMQFRREETTVRIERPTRLDRARSLGYKAKKGFVIIRQRVNRARRMRTPPAGGRRPKTSRMKLVLDMNYQQIAERRANRKFQNLEVLGSYEVARDGKSMWYEILFIDPKAPELKAQKPGVQNTKRRVFRGLTSAARKSRGLRRKGKGAEKVR